MTRTARRLAIVTAGVLLTLGAVAAPASAATAPTPITATPWPTRGCVTYPETPWYLVCGPRRPRPVPHCRHTHRHPSHCRTRLVWRNETTRPTR